MKGNNLVHAGIFFVIFMVCTYIFDKIIPGKSITFRDSLTIGLIASTVYFIIRARKDKKEE